MRDWNISKYEKLGDFVICLSTPNSSGAYTVGVRYNITYRGDNHLELGIDNNYDGQDFFNIHSPFGDNFCSLSYYRKIKLKNLQNVST